MNTLSQDDLHRQIMSTLADKVVLSSELKASCVRVQVPITVPIRAGVNKLSLLYIIQF